MTRFINIACKVCKSGLFNLGLKYTIFWLIYNFLFFFVFILHLYYFLLIITFCNSLSTCFYTTQAKLGCLVFQSFLCIKTFVYFLNYVYTYFCFLMQFFKLFANFLSIFLFYIFIAFFSHIVKRRFQIIYILLFLIKFTLQSFFQNCTISCMYMQYLLV